MWNGAAEALNARPARIIASPTTNSGSSGAGRLADRVEAELAGRAVDERRAEEQDRRAEGADDQVLEPRLERALAVGVERAEDVERDREPLEAEEQRHQVPGLDEEEHPGAGGREQRVVLADVARGGGRRSATSTASAPAPASTTCA